MTKADIVNSISQKTGIDKPTVLNIVEKHNTMPSGKKKKRHKMSTHKRKKRLRKNRHKSK